MKILHVSPSYYPAFKFGGPIQSVHLLNKSLVKLGIDLDVFTSNAGLKDAPIKVNQWIRQGNVNVKYFSFIGYEHYNFSITMFIALLKEIKKYDLVHITAVWNFPVWAACMACWLYKKPYVISPRGTIYPETIAIKSKSLKKIYYKLIAEKCLKRASFLHFTSKDEMENVTKHLQLANRSYVVPNGIDLSEFSNLNNINPLGYYFKELHEKKYLLFLGRINRKKGLDILFSAFKNILPKHSGLLLVIAGPDNEGYKNELQTLAENLKISNDIFYTGSLEGEKKLAAYKSAQLFVLSSYSENFGMSVVEAMACGCPVLISDKVGISNEILDNNAGYVSVNTIENWVNAIDHALKDDATREKIAINGRDMTLDHYNIANVALKMKELYNGCITSSLITGY